MFQHPYNIENYMNNYTIDFDGWWKCLNRKLRGSSKNPENRIANRGLMKLWQLFQILNVGTSTDDDDDDDDDDDYIKLKILTKFMFNLAQV